MSFSVSLPRSLAHHILLFATGMATLLVTGIPASVAQTMADSTTDTPAQVQIDMRTGEMVVVTTERGGPIALGGPAATEATPTGPTVDTPASFTPIFAVHQPTTVLPYSPIVKLTMTGWPSSNLGKECTGTLVFSRWVLTAAECVYDEALGGAPALVQVVPALTPNAAPFGSAIAESIFVWQPWVDDQNVDYNVAHIRLDRPIGALAGVHGIGFGADALFTDFAFSGLGYPVGDAFQVNKLHEWSGTFDTVGDRQVAHDQPGNAGMIGSAAIKKGDAPDAGWSAYAVYAPIIGESTSSFTRLVPELVQAVIDAYYAGRDPSFDPIPLDVNVVPGKVTAGGTLTKLDYMLFNDGASGFQGLIEHRLLLSTDINIDCENDIPLVSRSENLLIAPGDRPRITFSNVTVPADLGGDYFIGACAISQNDVGRTAFADDLAPITIDPLIPPKLIVAPTNLQMAGIVGEPVTTAQVSVQNTGGGALDWTVTSNQPWLSVSPASGVAVAGSPIAVSVSAEASALGPGGHEALLTFTAANGNTPKAVVALTLLPPNGGVPLLQVSPSLINFQATAGSPLPPAVAFMIDNLGGGTLGWQAVADVPWLKLNKSNGSGEASVSVSLKDIGALPRGTHFGTINVTADGAQASPQAVTVSLVIKSPPTLAVEGALLAFSAEVGGETPSPSSFFIRNDGDGPLNWTVSETIPWLKIEGPSNGSGAAEVGVSVQPAGLAAGTYSGTIRVAAAGAQASPKDIQVTLVMRPGPRLDVGPRQLLVDTPAGTGGPAGKSIDVFNRGLGTLNWNGAVTTTSGGNWVSLAQTSGNVGAGGRQIVGLTFNTAGLAPRVQPYEATVTINAPSAQGGSQTVNILLTVSSPAKMCNIAAGSTNWPVNASQVKVGIEAVQTTPTAGGGCDISGKLRLQLPQNASLSANFSGKVTSANKLTGRTSSSLDIGIASFKLRGGADFTLDETNGLQFTAATWQLPAEFGSITQPVNGTVRIAPSGIQIGGTKEFSLPNLNWGAISFNGNKATVTVATDYTYTLDIASDEMKVAVSGSPVATADDVTVRIDQRGVRTGSVGRFDINGFAGLRLEVLGATVEGDRLIAQQARLHMPKEWGEQYVSLYRVTINRNGKVDIGDAGGKFSFSLPSISAGGFTLTSLKGTLEVAPGGGYRINARGEFGLPEMKGVGTCQLWVDVTLRGGPNGESILEIAPAQAGGPLVLEASPETPQAPLSPDALVVEQFIVGLRCKPGIPISNTGLYAVGVEGTVLLKPANGGSQSITLKLWIESQAALGGTPMIGVEAAATIVPRPFELGLSATVELIGIETAKGTININSRRMLTEVEIQYHIVKLDGSMEVGRRPSDNKFYVNGSAGGSIGAQKGKIYEGCIDLIFDKVCASIPPSTLWLDVGHMDIGTFNTGGYGLKGYVGFGDWIPGWLNIPSQTGFFINFQNPSVKFGDVSSYQPIKPLSSQDYLAARAIWEDVSQNIRSSAELDERFVFNSDGGLSIPVPVESPNTGGQNRDSQHPIPVSVERDLMFILVQPQGSPLDMTLTRPDGVILTPDNLPDDAGYAEALNGTDVQTMYLVPKAMAGQWLVNLDGPDSDPTWGLFVIGNEPPPAFDQSKLSAKVKANPTTVEVKWELATNHPAQIAVYANNGATELPFTDSSGAAATTDSFTGVSLAEGVDSQAGKVTVDLKLVPSGTYALWIEADDGINPPVRHYIPNGGDIFRVTVDHDGSFPSQWTADIKLTPDIKDGSLLVKWQPLGHPNVDQYRLRLRYADPQEPASDVIREIETGMNLDGGGNQGVIDNIEPGQVYRVAVGGVDLDSGDIAWSQEVTLETAQPDFLLSAGQQTVALPACGVAAKVTVTVTPSDNLPEPVLLGMLTAGLPDGIYGRFDTEVVGEPLAVTLTLGASDFLPAGKYPVTITGKSGNLERTLVINVTAAGSAGEDCERARMLLLPVVVRP